MIKPSRGQRIRKWPSILIAPLREEGQKTEIVLGNQAREKLADGGTTNQTIKSRLLRNEKGKSAIHVVNGTYAKLGSKHEKTNSHSEAPAILCVTLRKRLAIVDSKNITL